MVEKVPGKNYTREKYAEYLQSDDWKKKRLVAYKKAGYKCELCGKRNIEAHHLVYLDWYSIDPLVHLIVLCIPHHEKIHRLPDPPKTRGEAFKRLKRYIKTKNRSQKTINKREQIEKWIDRHCLEIDGVVCVPAEEVQKLLFHSSVHFP